MENVKKFYEALRTDAELAEKLKAAGKAHEGKQLSEKERRAAIERDILPVIKAAGFDISLAELEAYGKSLNPKIKELADDELEAVAGGDLDCGCIAVGGGGGSDWEGDTYGCACVGYGQGGDAKDDHACCICVFGGNGTPQGFY